MDTGERPHDDGKRLRQHDLPLHCEIAEAEGLRCLDLTARNRLQSAADDLRLVGRSEAGDADHRAEDLWQIDAALQQQGQHDRDEEEDDHHRQGADPFDVDRAEGTNRRQLAAPAERQEHSDGERQRQRRDDQHRGDGQ